MTNIYRHRFTCTCPNNGQSVDYALEIEVGHTIMAEAIVAACAAARDLPMPYHENIADSLAAQFGGRQRIFAHHNGVDIETVRP